ncbi:MAG: glycosyltransferase family 2 protein [Candidatus Aenigmarchaeota archaeon]|nr:glycosyltransferase family 2 protein [Candidatus Aenigmarchaeota archaeon]
MKISIVIPAKNEEKSIPILMAKIKKVFAKLPHSYEIIFIDDGSADSTLEQMKKLKDNKVKIIQFRKNFGKSAALAAGFERAAGDVIFTMDADLQDEPEEIPKFLRELDKGYDLVSGWKFPRKDPFFKRMFSKVFNYMTSKISGLRLHDYNCGFKAYRKEVIKNISVHGDLHRYIPALAHWKGFKATEIKVMHHPRIHGKTKYGFKRVFTGFLDLLTVKFMSTYARKPMHFFGVLGGIFGAAGVLISAYMVYLKFLGASIIDRPLFMLGVLMIIVAVQFIAIGLIGDMVAPKEDEYAIKEEF